MYAKPLLEGLAGGSLVAGKVAFQSNEDRALLL